MAQQGRDSTCYGGPGAILASLLAGNAVGRGGTRHSVAPSFISPAYLSATPIVRVDARTSREIHPDSAADIPHRSMIDARRRRRGETSQKHHVLQQNAASPGAVKRLGPRSDSTASYPRALTAQPPPGAMSRRIYPCKPHNEQALDTPRKNHIDSIAGTPLSTVRARSHHE